jgi:hypothetical protein
MLYAATACGVAAVIAAASTVAAYMSSASTREVLTGIAMGVAGAWVSVVQRAWKLKVRPFERPQYLAFQGATRIVLGAVFGGFVVIALRAGLLLTILKDTSWGVAVASFIGGASERIVPELLRDNVLKMQARNTNGNGYGTPGSDQT